MPDEPVSEEETCPECGNDVVWDENGGLCDDCAENEELLAEYTGDK